MSEVPPIPSSVDTTGDLSRRKYNSRIQHYAPVGEPVGGSAYNPNKYQQHEAEGGNINPLRCAIVLGTLDMDGKKEYRIGKFRDSHQLHLGLTLPIRSGKNESPFALRSDVVGMCFGDSTIFSDRAEAVLAAENRFPTNNGIKVITTPYKFPSN